MGNDLQVFRNEYFGQLEMFIDENKKEWFPATDIALMLGYANPQKAIRDHCKEKGCTIRSVLTNGGRQNKKFIDEGNLYRLITHSELASAEMFESWVFDEVLPTIRKTGKYQTMPSSYAEALRELAATVEEKERLEEQNKIMAPKVEFYDSVAGSKDAIEMAHAAKVLSIKGFGRNNLFDFLREKDVLDKNNIPYQRFIDCGYFRTIEQKYNTPKGEIKINIKMLVYQKGLDYIRKLIEKEKSN